MWTHENSLIEGVKIKSYIYKSVNDLFTLIIESDDNIPSISKFSLKGISLEHKPLTIKDSKTKKYLIWNGILYGYIYAGEFLLNHIFLNFLGQYFFLVETSVEILTWNLLI